MKILGAFIIGCIFTATVMSVPAFADNVIIKCAPVLEPRCGNYLEMYFKYGSVPNRCKVS